MLTANGLFTGKIFLMSEAILALMIYAGKSGMTPALSLGTGKIFLSPAVTPLLREKNHVSKLFYIRKFCPISSPAMKDLKVISSK